jgi:hypothetical protein
MPLPFSFSRWLASSGWRASRGELASSFGRRARSEALAAARLEFAEALYDVRSAGAAATLDRIAVTRSLPELWHLREEVFSRVACRHDQAEAQRRLAALDQHFRRGSRATAFRAGGALSRMTAPGA